MKACKCEGIFLKYLSDGVSNFRPERYRTQESCSSCTSKKHSPQIQSSGIHKQIKCFLSQCLLLAERTKLRLFLQSLLLTFCPNRLFFNALWPEIVPQACQSPFGSLNKVFLTSSCSFTIFIPRLLLGCCCWQTFPTPYWCWSLSGVWSCFQSSRGR